MAGVNIVYKEQEEEPKTIVDLPGVGETWFVQKFTGLPPVEITDAAPKPICRRLPGLVVRKLEGSRFRGLVLKSVTEQYPPSVRVGVANGVQEVEWLGNTERGRVRYDPQEGRISWEALNTSDEKMVETGSKMMNMGGFSRMVSLARRVMMTINVNR